MIYGDSKIENEFLLKRKKLWYYLKSEGYDCDLSDFLETKFTHSLDNFLYMEVGYPVLSAMTVNLFYSPYGSTSIREYFANGFEAFYMQEDINRLKKISPELYKKIIEINKIEEEKNEYFY